MNKSKRKPGRPRKYVKDKRGREIVGLRLHASSGRYYDTDPTGRRVYFGTRLAGAVMLHRRWRSTQQPGDGVPRTSKWTVIAGRSVSSVAVPRSAKEQLRLQQQAEILDAALGLFVKREYHQVSMRQIAAAARLGLGTLYNYFPSKQALYREIVRGTANRIAAQVIEPLNGPGDELNRLKAFIANHNRTLLEHAAPVQMYFTRSRRPDASVEDPDGEIGRVRELVESRLASTIQAGIDRGVFRRLDATTAAISLLAALEAVSIRTILKDHPPRTETLTRQVEELFLPGIIRGGRT